MECAASCRSCHAPCMAHSGSILVQPPVTAECLHILWNWPVGTRRVTQDTPVPRTEAGDLLTAHLPQEVDWVLRHKGLPAALVHCLGAQRFQGESHCEGGARVADVILCMPSCASASGPLHGVGAPNSLMKRLHCHHAFTQHMRLLHAG